MTTPSVLIVGAGMAGLVAARHLTQHGHRVTLIDKGRGPGGRLATRRVAELPCDHGGQFMTVRDPQFHTLVNTWATAGWVHRWCHGVPTLTPTGLLPPDGHPRWIGTGGFRPLMAHLAEGLDLHQSTTVTRLAWHGTWQVTVSPGDLVRGTATGPERILCADAVLMTMPVPQAVALLTTSGLPATLPPVVYQPCLALALAWPTATTPILEHGLKVDDPSLAVAWLASQRSRGLMTSGEVLLIHARGDWTSANATPNLDQLIADARLAVERAGGHWPTETPAMESHRWRYSLPTTVAEAPLGQVPAPGPLFLAGDSWGGQPRIEGAALSGLTAAQRLTGD